MGKVAMAVLAATAIASGALGASTGPRKAPYWGSIGAGEARMRTGPGRNYPASWLYQRAGLPVRITETIAGWRKVRDPDGAEGWMISNLVSDQRTAMVRGETAALRDAPSVAGHVLWRAEPGVIGKVTECAGGWCRIDVKGRGGFVEAAHLWGVDADEKLD